MDHGPKDIDDYVKVVEGLTGIAHYISIRRYWRDGLDESRADDYYSYVGEAAFDFEEKITYTFPAHSITQIAVPIGK